MISDFIDIILDVALFVMLGIGILHISVLVAISILTGV